MSIFDINGLLAYVYLAAPVLQSAQFTKKTFLVTVDFDESLSSSFEPPQTTFELILLGKNRLCEDICRGILASHIVPCEYGFWIHFPSPWHGAS